MIGLATILIGMITSYDRGETERDLTRGEPVRLMIAANAVNGTKGGLGSAYLSRIVQDYGTSLSGPGLGAGGPAGMEWDADRHARIYGPGERCLPGSCWRAGV